MTQKKIITANMKAKQLRFVLLEDAKYSILTNSYGLFLRKVFD